MADEIVYAYGSQLKALTVESNVEENHPNAIKVSKTDNTLFFDAETTYQIGSSEIIAMCSNAIAVGTGQTGDAPLYVFCADGVYAMFVDSSGQMAYNSARVIARDVCNNAKSVTPIDAGVVFCTDRGLMMIAGEQVEEIGQPLEGDWYKFTNQDSREFNLIANNAYGHSYVDKEDTVRRSVYLGNLPDASIMDVDFLTFLKGSIVAYNHNERELMVSNPSKKYTFVMDREGNWTRRDYSAKEYVENYPVTYRLYDGKLIQIDKESDGDNGVFALSNIIKLESIGFKTVDRIVARGYFETVDADQVLRDNVTVAASARAKISLQSSETRTFGNEKKYRVTFKNKSVTGIDYVVSAEKIITKAQGTTRIDIFKDVTVRRTNGSTYVSFEITGASNLRDVNIYVSHSNSTSTACDYQIEIENLSDITYAGIYAFGSYDARRWVCLGHREKSGSFTDLGCNVERTDCKFYRILLAGQITKESRLDYFEVSCEQSKLSTKIR